MSDQAPRYRQENGVWLIEISLTSIDQLFNSFDPAPFHEKDLDADAEEYLVDAAREFPLGAPLKLVFRLPTTADVGSLTNAIHGYFAYRRDSAWRDLRFQLQDGRLALGIGLTFLAVCLGLRAIFLSTPVSALEHIVGEGLVIAGWVAMWRPLEIFLYSWWPLRRQARIYDKLAQVPVEVRPNETAAR
jgi:hypothetical protein